MKAKIRGNDIFCTDIDGNGVGNLVLYPQTSLFPYLSGVGYRITPKDGYAEELRSLASRVEEEYLAGNGDFAISQYDTAWFGRSSLTEFLDILTSYSARAEAYEGSIKTHHTESAAFVQTAAHPLSAITLWVGRATSGGIDDFGLSFLFGGIPADSEPIDRVINENHQEVSLGKFSENWTEKIQMDNWRKIPVNPIERIYDGEWNVAVICENPFYKNKKLRNTLIPGRFRALSNPRLVRLPLRNHSDEDEDLFVDKAVFEASKGAFIGSPFSVYQYRIFANW